jgi:iron-sulfur cluster repair protein YtfE (RIC family)
MQLINLDNLDVLQTCDYIEDKVYKEIEISISNVNKLFNNSQLYKSSNGLLYSLFCKLKEEVEFLKRKEILILFPFLKKVVNHTECRSDLLKSSPLESIRKNHSYLIDILSRLKQLANNYVVKHEWDEEYKLGIQNLHELDQQILMLVNVKENFLFPKMDAYKCSGSCKSIGKSKVETHHHHHH